MKPEWCCSAFQSHYEDAGSRFLGVLVERDLRGKPAFILQFRAVEIGQEQSLRADVAVSVASESHIDYCPWCGVRLIRFYARQVDSLCRPRLRTMPLL